MRGNAPSRHRRRGRALTHRPPLGGGCPSAPATPATPRSGPGSPRRCAPDRCGPRSRSSGPVELGDRAALDPDVARAGDVVDPERVAAGLEVVEDRGERRAAAGGALEHLLVLAAAVVAGRADL